jgi:hypothetical protein
MLVAIPLKGRYVSRCLKTLGYSSHVDGQAHCRRGINVANCASDISKLQEKQVAKDLLTSRPSTPSSSFTLCTNSSHSSRQSSYSLNPRIAYGCNLKGYGSGLGGRAALLSADSPVVLLVPVRLVGLMYCSGIFGTGSDGPSLKRSNACGGSIEARLLKRFDTRGEGPVLSEATLTGLDRRTEEVDL